MVLCQSMTSLKKNIKIGLYPRTLIVTIRCQTKKNTLKRQAGQYLLYEYQPLMTMTIDQYTVCWLAVRCRVTSTFTAGPGALA